MKKVKLITDGSCLGNPGPGGWAYILRYNGHKREMCGFAPHTTNNRMELTAAIEGLRALKERCTVEIVTDSEYVKNGISTWIHGWKRKNWVTSTKKPVVNRDLWEELDTLAAGHDPPPVRRPHQMCIVAAGVGQLSDPRSIRPDRINFEISIAKTGECDQIAARRPGGEVVVLARELGHLAILDGKNAETLLAFTRHTVHDALAIGRPARKSAARLALGQH